MKISERVLSALSESITKAHAAKELKYDEIQIRRDEKGIWIGFYYRDEEIASQIEPITSWQLMDGDVLHITNLRGTLPIEVVNV